MTIWAYVRVSTADQRCELQIRELREYGERQGWQKLWVEVDELRQRAGNPAKKASN